MLFMKFWLVLFCAALTVSCTKKADPVAETPQVEVVKSPAIPLIEKPTFSKVSREAIYFASSLEREALKLLLKDNSLQKNTLFSILSYIVETNAGARKSTPAGLDCGKYEIKKEKDYYSVLKICQRPYREVATITVGAEDKDFQIRFMIAQWGPVLGMSAVLTGSDVKCKMHLIDQKLNSLVCENWTYQVAEEQLSATVIKLDEFVFQRNAEQQFVIKGGFFKELVQNKKIDIRVPLEGKIKIIEKEIKVVDDFIDQKDGVIDGQKKFEIKPVEEKSRQELNKENQQENQNQTESQPQVSSQEGNQESGQQDQVGEIEKNGEAVSSTETTGGQSGRRGR